MTVDRSVYRHADSTAALKAANVADAATARKLGGVPVEVLEDVVADLAPVTPAQAMDILGRLKSKRLLQGYRAASIAAQGEKGEHCCRSRHFMRHAGRIRARRAGPGRPIPYFLIT